MKNIKLRDNFSIAETRRTMADKHPILVVLILFLLMQIPGTILGIGLVIYLAANNPTMMADPQSIMSFMMDDKMLLINLFFTIPVSLMALLFAYKYQKRNNASLGFNNPNKLTNYIKGALVGLLQILAIVLILKLIGAIELENTISQVSPLIFILFILGWIFQGFSEELITRSIWMNYFAVNNSVVAGVVINSILFAILHIGNTSFSLLPAINLFLSGVSFSLMFYVFDDIFFPAAAHSFWNFAQGNIFGINVSGVFQMKNTILSTTFVGSDLLTGGAFGIEGGLICTLVEIFVIAVLVKMIKDRGLDKPAEVLEVKEEKIVYEAV